MCMWIVYTYYVHINEYVSDYKKAENTEWYVTCTTNNMDMMHNADNSHIEENYSFENSFR